MPLGKVFDEEMERLVVKFWNHGINEGLSSSVINKLNQLKNAGYELVVKPSVSAGGKSPEPDLLFIKKISFGLNFNDCVYIDNKYFHDVGFTPPQYEIVKQFDGVSTESVVTTNQLMTVNGVDINMGTVLKIKEIGIFTVDELLKMASILKRP